MSPLRRVPLVALLLALGALPATAGPVLTGAVRGVDGEPLADAVVALSPAADRYALSAMLLAGQPGPEPMATTRTRDDGTFRLVAPSIGMSRLEVTADGHVPAQLRLRPLLVDLDLEPVTLAKDTGLDLRLVDPEGRPLAEVPVVAYRSARSTRETRAPGFDLPEPVWHGAPAIGATDADGALRLAASTGETLWIQATPPGFPQLLERVEVGADAAELTARPAPVGRLVAHDLRGRPIEGVFVHADRQPLPIARTDERGQARFAIPVGRPTRLDLSSADGDWGTFTLTAETDEADGLAELTLQPPRRVRGQVLDHLSGRPLARALVWPRGAPARATLTDRSGGFELTISAREELLIAAFETHRPATEPVGLDDPDDAPLVTLRPQAACAAAGRIVDPEGEGIADAELVVISDQLGEPRAGRPWPWRTDAAGAFHLDRLACGEQYFLRTRAAGYVRAENPLPRLDPGRPARDLVFTLDPGRRASGRVVDAREAPIADAEIELIPSLTIDELRRRWHERNETTSEVDGAFTFVDLPVGRFDLLVHAEGFASVTIPGVEIDDAPWTDLGTVLLDRGLSLDGRVVDDLDRPVAAAEIFALAISGHGSVRTWYRRGDDEPVRADAEGRFRLDGLQPDVPITVRAIAPGHAEARLDDVLPAEEPLRIVLARASMLTGRVVDGAGWPIEGVRVAATHPGSDRRSASGSSDRTDNLGRFELDGLPAGPARLSVRAARHEDRSLPVIVPEPGVDGEPIEIVLEDGSRLDGRVLSPDGEPVEGAVVKLTTTNSERTADQTDGAGRFRLDGLSDGTFTLVVGHERYGTTRRHVEIGASETFVEVRFPARRELAGRVADGDGEPLVGARIQILQAESGTTTSFETDRDGRFSIPVADGTYTVRVAATGHVGAVREVEVGDAPVTEVDIVLRRGATIRGTITGLSLDELSRVAVSAQGKAVGTDRFVFQDGRVIDFEGRYEISGFEPGSYRVVADLDRESRKAIATVEIGTEPLVDGVTLEFVEGFEVSGVVLLDGQPAPGVAVSLRATTDELGLRATTTQSGRFRLSDVPGGSYELSVYGDDGHLEERSLRVDGDIELTIEPGGTDLVGRVVDPDGKPLELVEIHLRRSPGRGSIRFTRSDVLGNFRIRSLEPGAWTVRVSALGWTPWQQTVEIPVASAPPPLEIRLQPVSSLRLRVVRADGRPVRHVVWTTLGAAGEGTLRYAESDDDGQFKIDLAAGSARLALAEQRGVATVVDASVPGDAGTITLPVTGQLAANLRTEGRALRLALARPGGAAFPLIGTGATDHDVVVAGRADGLAVPVGPWIVRVTDPEGHTAELPITITADETTTLDLD